MDRKFKSLIMGVTTVNKSSEKKDKLCFKKQRKRKNMRKNKGRKRVRTKSLSKSNRGRKRKEIRVRKKGYRNISDEKKRKT